MCDTSSRLLDLLSLLQARRDWPGGELAERLEVSRRTVRRDVEPAARARVPRGVAHRAGRRLPPARRHRDAAAAARRGGGDRDRGRPAHRRAGVGQRASRRPRSARWSSSSRCCPAHLRRRVAALGSATIAAPVGGPTVDPQHLTTIAAACRDAECLRFDYRSRDGTETRRERRAALAREPRAALVPRRLGPPPRGLADVPRRPAGRPGRRPASGSRRARCRRRTPPRTSQQSITGARSRYEVRVTVHAPAEEVARRLPWLAGALEPIDDAALRVPHLRRRPRVARAADRDARRRRRRGRSARAAGPAGRARPAAGEGGARQPSISAMTSFPRTSPERRCRIAAGTSLSG